MSKIQSFSSSREGRGSFRQVNKNNGLDGAFSLNFPGFLRTVPREGGEQLYRVPLSSPRPRMTSSTPLTVPFHHDRRQPWLALV
jgi:hypothetical protein